ncbi:hypothetical protein OIU79_022045 [Salix purpurea]|uniref:Uncharacterized protein n=2 Tax=Salix TaxID=40685 RepID=A0A9Q0ZLR3_9ROSI|nr:hypothetical protein OIU74_004014 [Salix koriyanagi]KAJ6765993.1 hypothetical protein OIU79_022045 [Salix purpurea]
MFRQRECDIVIYESTYRHFLRWQNLIGRRKSKDSKLSSLISAWPSWKISHLDAGQAVIPGLRTRRAYLKKDPPKRAHFMGREDSCTEEGPLWSRQDVEGTDWVAFA